MPLVIEWCVENGWNFNFGWTVPLSVFPFIQYDGSQKSLQAASLKSSPLCGLEVTSSGLGDSRRILSDLRDPSGSFSSTLWIAQIEPLIEMKPNGKTWMSNGEREVGSQAVRVKSSYFWHNFTNQPPSSIESSCSDPYHKCLSLRFRDILRQFQKAAFSTRSLKRSDTLQKLIGFSLSSWKSQSISF